MEDITKELANEVLNTLKATKGFVLEQAPDIAQEIVAYGRVFETATLILSGLFFAAGLFFLVKFLRIGFKEKVEGWIFAGLVTGMPSILALVSFLQTIKPLALAWAAPKLYIIQYLGKIIGGSCG